jgi:hypothetical protein
MYLDAIYNDYVVYFQFAFGVTRYKLYNCIMFNCIIIKGNV